MAVIETVFKIGAIVVGANAVKELGKSIDGVSTSGEKMKRSFAQGALALKTFAAGAIAQEVVNLGRQIVEIADKQTLLIGRLKLSTQSSAEFQMALNGLQKQSEETGSDIGDMLDVFQRISFVRKEIGATVPEMLTFTETVGKLGAMSGASPDAMKNGLLQLGQALSSSKMRAEEFNSVVENMPAIAAEIAAKFGVTTGQLRQLVLKGLVDSKDVFRAVLDGAEETRKKFNELPPTVGRSVGTMNAMLGQSVAIINESSGATDILGSLLVGLGYIAKGAAVAIVSLFEGIKVTIVTLGETIHTTIMLIFNSLKGAVLEQLNTIQIGFNNIIAGANVVKQQMNKLLPEGSQMSMFEQFDVKASGEYTVQSMKDNADQLKAGYQAIETQAKSSADAISKAYNQAFNPDAVKPPAEGAKNTPTAANAELSKKYQELLKQVGGGGAKSGGAKSASERAVEASTEWLAKQREEIETLKQQVEYIGKTSVEIEKLKDARKIDTEAAEKAANLSGSAREKFLQEAEAIKKIRQEVLEKNYAMSRSASAGATDFFAKYAEEASNMAEQIKGALSNAFKGAEDALVGFVTTGKLNFKSLAQSIISDLARIAIRSAITGPLAKALGSAFSGGTVSPFANGGIMTSQGSMPLKAYASGGVANSPQLALFGEGRMPEAYVPLPDGRTIPVTMQGGGGGQVNQVTVNVNMQGGDQTTANSKQANDLGKLIASTVKGILINEKRAGGLLAGA